MHILREFAVNRLPRRILHAFFELELILFFLRLHEFTRLRDINTKLLRHLIDPEMTTIMATANVGSKSYVMNPV